MADNTIHNKSIEEITRGFLTEKFKKPEIEGFNSKLMSDNDFTDKITDEVIREYGRIKAKEKLIAIDHKLTIQRKRFSKLFKAIIALSLLIIALIFAFQTLTPNQVSENKLLTETTNQPEEKKNALSEKEENTKQVVLVKEISENQIENELLVTKPDEEKKTESVVENQPTSEKPDNSLTVNKTDNSDTLAVAESTTGSQTELNISLTDNHGSHEDVVVDITEEPTPAPHYLSGDYRYFNILVHCCLIKKNVQQNDVKALLANEKFIKKLKNRIENHNFYAGSESEFTYIERKENGKTSNILIGSKSHQDTVFYKIWLERLNESTTLENQIKQNKQTQELTVTSPLEIKIIPLYRSMNIQWESDKYESLNLVVFSCNGKKLHKQEVTSQFLYKPKLPEGLYYWQLRAGKKVLHTNRFHITAFRY